MPSVEVTIQRKANQIIGELDDPGSDRIFGFRRSDGPTPRFDDCVVHGQPVSARPYRINTSSGVAEFESQRDFALCREQVGKIAGLLPPPVPNTTRRFSRDNLIRQIKSPADLIYEDLPVARIPLESNAYFEVLTRAPAWPTDEPIQGSSNFNELINRLQTNNQVEAWTDAEYFFSFRPALEPAPFVVTLTETYAISINNAPRLSLDSVELAKSLDLSLAASANLMSHLADSQTLKGGEWVPTRVSLAINKRTEPRTATEAIGDLFYRIGLHERDLRVDAYMILRMSREQRPAALARALIAARPDAVKEELVKHATHNHQFLSTEMLRSSVNALCYQAAKPLRKHHAPDGVEIKRPVWYEESDLFEKGASLVEYHLRSQGQGDEARFKESLVKLAQHFIVQMDVGKLSPVTYGRIVGAEIGCFLAGALRAADQIKERDAVKKDMLKDGITGLLNGVGVAGGPIGTVVAAAVGTAIALTIDAAWKKKDPTVSVNKLRGVIGVQLDKCSEADGGKIDINTCIRYIDFVLQCSGYGA